MMKKATTPDEELEEKSNKWILTTQLWHWDNDTHYKNGTIWSEILDLETEKMAQEIRERERVNCTLRVWSQS